MAAQNLGRVGFVLRGDWLSTTSYTELDVVTYNGNSWAAKKDNSNVTPSTENSEYWQLLSNSETLLDSIESLVGAISAGDHPTGVEPGMFEQGGIANGTGANYDSNYFVRTAPIAIIPGSAIRVLNNTVSGFRYDIHQYAVDKSWISALAIQDQSAEKAFQIAPTAYYVRFAIKKADNSAIAPADLSNAKIYLDWQFDTKTMTQGNSAAISGGTLSVSESVQQGYHRYPIQIHKGVTYSYKNLTGAPTNLYLYDLAGNQLYRISGNVLNGESVTFKAEQNAEAIGGYVNTSLFAFTLTVSEGLAEKVNNLGNAEANHLALNAQHIPGSNDGALTLLHFSDIHADTIALSRIMADAAKISGITGMICTGDMVANVGGAIDSWWPETVLTAVGNHDTATWDGTSYDWTAVSVADRISYYISPFESNWGITRPSGKSYYYKDYAQGIRLIVMDVMLYTAGGADATAQTTWLSGLLSDAISSDLHVLIAIHAPHVSSAVDCNFSKYGQGVWSGDASCNTPQAVIDAVASAIAGGLHFVGYLCGHTHQDNIWDAAGDGTQLMYGITCAATTSRPQWVNSDQDRTGEQDAFNLVTIDPARRLLKIIRGGGANVDDHLRSRKTICIDYSTNTIVSEN